MPRDRTRTIGWVVFAACLVVCIAAGALSYKLADYSWSAVVDYRSPYVKAPLPAAQATAPLAGRVVVVIVDGLRYDASLKMHTLAALRTHGADLQLVAPQPSLSFPNWTTLLSGAPPYVSGVVTNWHKGTAPVETLFDVAASAQMKTVCVGSEGFEQLYRVREKCDAVYLKEWKGEYLSGELVDHALALTKSREPQLLVVHLPDVDEAGHGFGGVSRQYGEAVSKVDYDLNRLVGGLQDGNTVFAVVADHGHIDTGGHGGWEPQVVTVPAVFAGPRIGLGRGVGTQEQFAPTIAAIAGLPVPRYATREQLSTVLGLRAPRIISVSDGQRTALEAVFDSVVGPGGAERRLGVERRDRLPVFLGGLTFALLVVLLIGLSSWRALVAALAGGAAYFSLYNGLFFVVHGYRWSLSSFNAEKYISLWMNMRLAEAAVAAVLAALVAAVVYPYLREHPKGPRGPYLPGWLTLGPATLLVVIALLGGQVAWFAWWWGIDPTWMLPDLKWGFKYDLDLLQATAVGFASMLAPLVTYLVGRYHPRITSKTDSEE